jgi:hypothetical protein
MHLAAQVRQDGGGKAMAGNGPQAGRAGDDEKRLAESRRILAHINSEMEPTGLAHRVGGHFAARDADQNDRIEVIGRRIGRALSLALTVGLAVWLYLFLTR